MHKIILVKHLLRPLWMKNCLFVTYAIIQSITSSERCSLHLTHPSALSSATLPISVSGSSRQSSDDHVITLSEDEVRRELRRVNVRKAARPDGIIGRVLRSCADQLSGLFTSIFNESLATSVVPTSFKKSVIIPVPKNSKPSCLNDYRSVALTSIVMKVFERLVKNYI